jgi:hypothetical protein
MHTTFDADVCSRLPLADAAFRLLQHATDARFLTDVFERHRGRSYQGVIEFPLFARLVLDSLLGHRGPSARQTFLHAQQECAGHLRQAAASCGACVCSNPIFDFERMKEWQLPISLSAHGRLQWQSDEFSAVKTPCN